MFTEQNTFANFRFGFLFTLGDPSSPPPPVWQKTTLFQDFFATFPNKGQKKIFPTIDSLHSSAALPQNKSIWVPGSMSPWCCF